jgi:hypothetical protein
MDGPPEFYHRSHSYRRHSKTLTRRNSYASSAGRLFFRLTRRYLWTKVEQRGALFKNLYRSQSKFRLRDYVNAVYSGSRARFNKSSSFSIGTFNIRSATEIYKRCELAAWCFAHCVDVMVVQEHRIVRQAESYGEFGLCTSYDFGHGWCFLGTGGNLSFGGVGVVLSPRALLAIVNITVVLEGRIMLLEFNYGSRCEAKCGNGEQISRSRDRIFIIACYAPTAVAGHEQDSTIFYSKLDEAVANISCKHLLFVLGDFNAMLVQRNKPNGYRHAIYSSNVITNLNTDVMTEFMDHHDLLPMNLRFKPAKIEHLNTFHGPNHRRVCLDYALCRRRWQRSVQNVQIYHTKTIRSDHRAVVLQCRWVLKNRAPLGQKFKKRRCYDYKVLQHKSCREAFHQLVQNINPKPESYESFVEAIVKAVSVIVPPLPLQKERRFWKFPNVEQLREEVDKGTRSLSSLREQYAVEDIRFLDDMMRDIEVLHGEHQLRRAYQCINYLAGRKVKKKTDIVAASSVERLGIWRNHFEKVLTFSTSEACEQAVFHSVDFGKSLTFKTGAPTLVELRFAILAAKTHKASGVDEIPAEIWKWGGIEKSLLHFIVECYFGRNVPVSWKEALIVPVPKKGDLTAPDNYRGIALMCVAAKLYNRIILKRLQDALESVLRINQNGFRVGRSTVQHILVVRRLMEAGMCYQGFKGVVVFVDFTKAFDSIFRPSMWNILRAYGVPEELILAIRNVYDGFKAKVRTSDGMSDAFSVTNGVLQGDTLAPYLFCIVLDWVLRMVVEPSDGVTLVPGRESKGRFLRGSKGVKVTDTDFADDIAFFSDSFVNMQSMLDRLELYAGMVNLSINRKKTEFMLFGEWPHLDCSNSRLHLFDGEINHVDDFKYLGAWVRSSDSDMRRRKGLAWDAVLQLWRIWKSRLISDSLKFTIFRSIVVPIFSYGCETWALTHILNKEVDTFYSKMLRFIFQIRWWEFRRNEDIFREYGNFQLSQYIRIRRLIFAGHCLRARESVPQPVMDVVLWHPSFLHFRKRSLRRSYLYVLLNDVSLAGVDIEHPRELCEIMQDRVFWRNEVIDALSATPVLGSRSYENLGSLLSFQ